MPSPYTDAEHMQILNYIITNELFYDVKGNRMWVEMANKTDISRTWQSLKEHYRRKMLPNLNYFPISNEHKVKLKEGGPKSNSSMFKRKRNDSDNKRNVKLAKQEREVLDTDTETSVISREVLVAQSKQPNVVSIENSEDDVIVEIHSDCDSPIQQNLGNEDSLFIYESDEMMGFTSDDENFVAQMNNFSREDNIKIIKYFEEDYSRLKGIKKNFLYNKMAKIFSKRYTYKALKKQFTKKIMPRLDDFISKEEVEKFYSYAGIPMPSAMKERLSSTPDIPLVNGDEDITIDLPENENLEIEVDEIVENVVPNQKQPSQVTTNSEDMIICEVDGKPYVFLPQTVTKFKLNKILSKYPENVVVLTAEEYNQLYMKRWYQIFFQNLYSDKVTQLLNRHLDAPLNPDFVVSAGNELNDISKQTLIDAHLTFVHEYTEKLSSISSLKSELDKNVIENGEAHTATNNLNKSDIMIEVIEDANEDVHTVLSDESQETMSLQGNDSENGSMIRENISNDLSPICRIASVYSRHDNDNGPSYDLMHVNNGTNQSLLYKGPSTSRATVKISPIVLPNNSIDSERGHSSRLSNVSAAQEESTVLSEDTSTVQVSSDYSGRSPQFSTDTTEIVESDDSSDACDRSNVNCNIAIISPQTDMNNINDDNDYRMDSDNRYSTESNHLNDDRSPEVLIQMVPSIRILSPSNINTKTLRNENVRDDLRVLSPSNINKKTLNENITVNVNENARKDDIRILTPSNINTKTLRNENIHESILTDSQHDIRNKNMRTEDLRILTPLNINTKTLRSEDIPQNVLPDNGHGDTRSEKICDSLSNDDADESDEEMRAILTSSITVATDTDSDISDSNINYLSNSRIPIDHNYHKFEKEIETNLTETARATLETTSSGYFISTAEIKSEIMDTSSSESFQTPSRQSPSKSCASPQPSSSQTLAFCSPPTPSDIYQSITENFVTSQGSTQFSDENDFYSA